MKPADLKDHIAATYRTVRIGAAVLAIALPFVLWIGGHILADLPLQQSMSAYYHGGGGAMRDEFVGILFTVGAFLILYKGYTNLENYALNLAGVFLVGVAVFPMEWECDNSCSRFSLHGIFAVLFFLLIAYVCLFRASDTLGLIPDQAQVNRYKRAYTLMGLGMVASPAVAVLLSFVLQPHSDARSTIFFVEAVGVFIFGSYWILKSPEIARTKSERCASEGKLTTRQLGVADMFKQISVARIEPLPKP